jgi:hypothetical protein
MLLENNLYLKIFIGLFLCLVIFIANKSEDLNYLFFTIYYLFAYSAYSIIQTGIFPLWVVILCIVITFSLLGYSMLKDDFKASVSLWFNNMLFGVVGLELFIALIFWPANYQSKSIILLIFIYLFWQIISIRYSAKKFDKSHINQLIILIISLIIIISSISWRFY